VVQFDLAHITITYLIFYYSLIINNY